MILSAAEKQKPQLISVLSSGRTVLLLIPFKTPSNEVNIQIEIELTNWKRSNNFSGHRHSEDTGTSTLETELKANHV